MKARVRVTGEAEADVAALSELLAGRSPDLGLRFHDCFVSTLESLADAPRIGRPRTFGHAALQACRTWPIDGFPWYLIFYRSIDDGIEILRVIHGAHDLESLLGND